MEIHESVIALLKKSGSEPLSGEEIAKAVGVSRNSIWKAIKKLKEEGYVITASTNKGYTLLSTGDVLTASEIEEHLAAENAGLNIRVQDTVTSTNTVLKEAAEKGGEEGNVLIARQQTQGKGRIGRTFYSPERSGLYMSILLKPKYTAEVALYITTAAAVAVANAIEETTGIEAAIKWVNDVYVKGKKVCGILTEASVDFENNSLSYAVLGIGINIKIPSGGFDKELAKVATALYENHLPEGIYAKLAASILNHFMGLYQTLEQKTFMDAYREYSFLTGKKINYTQGNLSESGTVIGIDDDARLLVRVADGSTKAYAAGEVQILKDFIKETGEA